MHANPYYTPKDFEDIQVSNTYKYGVRIFMSMNYTLEGTVLETRGGGGGGGGGGALPGKQCTDA